MISKGIVAFFNLFLSCSNCIVTEGSGLPRQASPHRPLFRQLPGYSVQICLLFSKNSQSLDILNLSHTRYILRLLLTRSPTPSSLRRPHAQPFPLISPHHYRPRSPPNRTGPYSSLSTPFYILPSGSVPLQLTLLYAFGRAKMMPRHSHAYSNGHAYSPSKHHSSNTFSISPHRFQPRTTRPALLWRRQLVVKLCGIAFAASVFLLFIFPSFRQLLLPSLSLGFILKDDPRIATVHHYDLSNVQGTARGWERNERILMCVPLRDAESHLPMFFAHMRNFTYPHHLIDLAFLVSDSKDNTLGKLKDMLEDLQNDSDESMPYGEITLIEKDFGQKVKQDVENRHGFAAQASRRKTMAQARNWLLSAALKPHHSWVYWRDADVETAPPTILEDLMRHNKDVIVPNVWRPLPDWLGGEQPYDLNSWQESETALALADTLDEDAVIVEGYAEYATWRPHLAYLRDPYGDPDVEMEIDGVGGVSILAKAKVFRAGCHFPAFSFEKHAETEGFGKMAKRMQFSVVGLPHYTIWHLYEPSADDIKHMERMEEERKMREQQERLEKEKQEKLLQNWNNPKDQWENDKKQMEKGAGKGDKLAGGEAGPHAHAGEGEAKAKGKSGTKEGKKEADENGIVDTQGKDVDADDVPAPKKGKKGGRRRRSAEE